MKRIYQTLIILLFIGSSQAQSPAGSVNPVIGDESYIALFGTLPDKNSDNQLRVIAHLSYMEYRLKEKTVEGLSEQQQKNRALVLNHLHDYWTNGIFPSNYDYPDERRPCFIDRDGKICAVGYLIEQTAGLEVAQQINEKHQYDYLLDMKEEVINEWAEAHGLTLEECAMIQPTYGPPPAVIPTQESLKTGYGVSSGIIGGFNLAVNAINLSGRYGSKKTIAYLGLMSGVTQVLLGASNIRKDQKVDGPWVTGIITTYKAQNNVSYVNIAMGTTTILTSAFNLYVNSKIKDKKNSVGLYSYTGFNNEMNIGLSLARRL